jgi:alpha-ketoglutarate-dependent taurine dioxygenase
LHFLAPLDETQRISLLADPDQFWQTLDRCGAMLFRDHRFDLDAFVAYASRFNQAFMTTTLGDRKTLHDRKEVQTVTLGNHHIGFHFEYGNNGRLRPDLLWLYCRRPPAPGTGGETLTTDGAAIFEKLPAGIRAMLAERRVRFVNYIPEKGFRSMMRHPAFEAVVGGDVVEAIERDSDMRILGSTADGRIVFEVIAPAVRTAPDGRMYLCQNILENPYVKPTEPEARHFFSMQMLWEDGTPIADDVLLTLQRAASESMLAVDWKAGDFLVVDNNRMLHGRNASTDPLRDIVVLCSFSNRYRYVPARHSRPYTELQTIAVPLARPAGRALTTA